MTAPVKIAGEVMAAHGWQVRSEVDLAELHVDVVAESEAAIVFFEQVPARDLVRSAETLSSLVGSVTLGPNVGVKVWEAYLVLIVETDFERVAEAAQVVQQNLDYCRKVVLDGASIIASTDPRAAMTDALSFLFPLDFGGTAEPEDVREHLISSLTSHGLHHELVTELVTMFDAEPECHCLERVAARVPRAEDLH